MIEVEKYDFKDIEGITEKQLYEHYQLYKGYVFNINLIRSDLKVKENYANSNSIYSKLRSLMLGQSYALDGVKLHELYFQNLGGKINSPYGKVLKKIEKDFGSYDNFKKMFSQAALSIRGWVVLAVDSTDDKLYIFGSDAHDVGAIWKANPILILDMYEHAYMIDFGIDKKKYIEIFFRNINWQIVNKRLIK